MNVVKTAFPEVLLLEPRLFSDERGFVFESYNRRAFMEATGIDPQFVQDNHSHSRRNVIRGLHYQIRHEQGKLVRCVVGEVLDVVVDIRRASPSFGRWTAVVLSAENRRMLWVPPGFAHGFAVHSDTAQVLYKLSGYYAPEWERCLRWDDAELAVDWGLSGEPVLSPKDRAGVLLRDAELYG